MSSFSVCLCSSFFSCWNVHTFRGVSAGALCCFFPPVCCHGNRRSTNGSRKSWRRSGKKRRGRWQRRRESTMKRCVCTRVKHMQKSAQVFLRICLSHHNRNAGFWQKPLCLWVRAPQVWPPPAEERPPPPHSPRIPSSVHWLTGNASRNCWRGSRWMADYWLLCRCAHPVSTELILEHHGDGGVLI